MFFLRLFLFLACLSQVLVAQDRATWRFSSNHLEDETYELIFEAQIDEGWTIYSMFLEDGGPIPTSLTLESKHQELLGKASEQTKQNSNRKSGYDDLFDMNVIKYKNDLTIKQKIKVAKQDANKPVQGYVTFMACDHEKCMPPTDVDFSLKLPAPKESIDKPNTEPQIDTAATKANIDSLKQLIQEGPDTNKRVFNPVNEKLKTSLKAAEALGACTSSDKSLAQVGTDGQNDGLGMVFIFGFLGGLLALLTPCVFPMVPLTVSYFTKQKKGNGLRDALIYGASIVVIYVSLGLLITWLFGETALNWLSTHWLPNTFFFVLFVAFALSFFGYYDIKLPSSWSNKSDQAADRGGLLGIFFMAFTLSLVSFSCTGPIIGALLVQTATGGNLLGPSIGMLGFSLALALPFSLFSAFPAWLSSLPRSGGWMNTVKVVLGFIELALAFKFLSKADLVENWGILKYETFMLAVALSFLGLALYFWGWIRFPHDNPKEKIGWTRRLLGVLSLGLVVYLGLGFRMHPETKTYWTPNLMSGLAPPACYSYVYPCKCPAGINTCFKDYEEGLRYAKAQNKPILLDFTGHGCENCRRMEDNIWIEPKINALINDEYVLISLYVDERSALPEQLKTADGKTLRTVGSLWAHFQVVNFERSSQPWYALVSPDEQVLNPPVGAIFDAAAYEAFLRCGLERFRNKN